RGVDEPVRVLGHALPADQRFREPLRVVHVVESEAALDAEAAVVGRAVPALHLDDASVPDVERGLATHAAVGAEGVDLAFRDGVGGQARRHERAGRACLHALAASHARALAHGVFEVEDDAGVRAAAGVADDVVHLLLAARADAAGALDAGVEADEDRRVGRVGRGLGPRCEAWPADLQEAGPVVELGVVAVRLGRHVGEEQLDDHALGLAGALAGRADLHAGCRLAAAGGREDALARDLDHAGAAVPVRAHAFRVAEARDLDAVAL